MECDTDQLRLSARTLTQLQQQADTVAQMADTPDPSLDTWGQIGAPFAVWYVNTARDVHEDLESITACLGSKVEALERTAENVEACDQGVAEALQYVEAALADPARVAGLRIDTGGVTTTRLDPSEELPLASTGASSVASTADLAGDDSDWTDLSNAMGSTAELGATGASAAPDPFHTLISNGLGFLVDVVQPLDDALGLVTGHPEHMEAEIQRWQQVGAAQEHLADAVRTVADEGLVGWRDSSATVAKRRLHAFADGVDGTRQDIRKVAFICEIAKATMEIARDVIVGLTATFVEWLVYTWATATATAAVTFGGSTAAASAATAGRFAQVMTRVRMVISKVVQILRTVRRVLSTIAPRRMARVRASFPMRDQAANTARWAGAQEALTRWLTDWKSHLRSYATIVDTSGTYASRQADDD